MPGWLRLRLKTYERRRTTTTKRCCLPTRAQSRRRRSMGYVKTGCPPRQRGPVARAGGFPFPLMRAWLEQPHGHHKAPPPPCALTTTWWLLLLPLQMGKKRVSERATRGGEGRNTAVSGHRIPVVCLGKPSEPVQTRRLRSLGARVLGGSSAWCVGAEVARRPPAHPGPVAEAPDVDLRRTARSLRQAKPGLASGSG